jgi:hypothetical protein
MSKGVTQKEMPVRIPQTRTPQVTPESLTGFKRQISSTLMFAVSSSRHESVLLARERFRMAAVEQGRRRDHQDDG